MAENIYSFLASHLSSQGSKSNVLKPLMFILVFLLATICFLVKFNLMIFAYVFLGVFVLILIGFLFTYFYCLFKDPDLLRSEKYNLEKTAMEKTAILGSTDNSYKILPGTREYVVYNNTNKVEE